MSVAGVASPLAVPCLTQMMQTEMSTKLIQAGKKRVRKRPAGHEVVNATYRTRCALLW